MIAQFAESATYVRPLEVDDELRFEIVTGMLDEDSPLGAYGHTVVLIVQD